MVCYTLGMKSNLTLKELYDIAYKEEPPFSEEKNAGCFFTCALIADLVERQVSNEDRIGIMDLYCHYLNKLNITLDDLDTYFCKSLKNFNIDAALYGLYSQDELFDICADYPEYVLEKLGVNFDNVVDGELPFKPGHILMIADKKIFINILFNGKNKFGDLTETKEGKAIIELIDLYYSKKSGKVIQEELINFFNKNHLSKDIVKKSREDFLCSYEQLTVDDITYAICMTDKEKEEYKKEKNQQKQQALATNNFTNINDLPSKIIGQEFAVAKVKNALISAGVGFRDENQPIASFLLTGPTGVGKTETAKAVASACFNDKIYVVDMSTYKSEIDVSRLLGGSPNYVGYNDKNGFCDFLKENPNSVILFDEIEKGHSGCLDLLMRILDEGEFINAKGETISLKNTVIFCTTNLSQNIKKTVGFGNVQSTEQKLTDDEMGLKKELIGRFTDVIEYKQLSNEACKQITKEKFLKSVIEKFEKNNAQGLKIEYTDEIVEEILKDANTNLLGARDLKKAIRKVFITPISEYIALNNCKNTTLVVTANGIMQKGNKKQANQQVNKFEIEKYNMGLKK